MREKISFVTITFQKNDEQKLVDWTSKNIGEEFLYYSDDIDSYVNGNVTDSLHMTIAYGLDSNKIDISKVENLTNLLDIESVILGEIKEFTQPDASFKTIYIEVLDEDGKINDLRKNILKYPYFEKYQLYKFTPHITLAFVKNNFEIPENNFIGTELQVDRLNYISKK